MEIIDATPRKRAGGWVDHTLPVKVNTEAQPVAVALIEAKDLLHVQSCGVHVLLRVTARADWAVGSFLKTIQRLTRPDLIIRKERRPLKQAGAK